MHLFQELAVIMKDTDLLARKEIPCLLPLLPLVNIYANII